MITSPLFVDKSFIDSLAEILTVAMGNASSLLSNIVQKKVGLNLSNVEFVSRKEVIQHINDEHQRHLNGVVQCFNGAFFGDVMLLFKENQSLQLVRRVSPQENVELEEFVQMEKDALTEIGNVILNACLCHLSDMFEKEIFGDVPEFIEGAVKDFFSTESGMDFSGTIVMLLNINCSIEQKDVQAYMVFLMDTHSVSLLKKNVEFLSEYEL